MEIKHFCLSFIPFIIMGITICAVEREKIMDKIIREKNSFSAAIEALKDGKKIHRSGEIKYICSRKIVFDGNTTTEYGYKISDREFTNGVFFDLEDVLSNDWIIEESK